VAAAPVSPSNNAAQLDTLSSHGNLTALHGIKCDCSSAHLEYDCSCTGIPVIKDVGFDASIDTVNYEINVNIEFDGHSYSLLHLSAHNPKLCIDAVEVAKICAKVDNLQWDNHRVTGTLYLGVGIKHLGTKWFKVTDMDIPYIEAPVRLAPDLAAQAPVGSTASPSRLISGAR